MQCPEGPDDLKEGKGQYKEEVSMAKKKNELYVHLREIEWDQHIVLTSVERNNHVTKEMDSRIDIDEWNLPRQNVSLAYDLFQTENNQGPKTQEEYLIFP